MPPGLCQVLWWTWLWYSMISSVQSYWTETWWPRTCLSKRDKCLFHDYRERLKLLRAYITSQEVVQHKAAIPTKAITPFLSLSFISSEIPDMLLFYPAPPFIVNPSSHRNAMHFRCCHFGGIICCSVSPSLSTHWNYVQHSPEGLSQAYSTLCCVGTCCVSSVISYLE